MKKLLLTLMALGIVFTAAACTAQGEEPEAAINVSSATANTVPASQEQIVDVVWQWSDLTETEPAGQSVVPNSENYTVTFLRDGSANVRADCNRINWSYKMEGDKITFDTLFAGTLVACGPDSLEQSFLQNLGKVECAELQNGRLILNLNDGGQMGFINGGAPTTETPSAENPINRPPFDTIVPNFVGKTWEWEKF
ncbi:MAG: META domain-containing protein [Anaerolineae bacterium]|nr:META domain-containing protein [Anaerolineae bacterium]